MRQNCWAKSDDLGLIQPGNGWSCWVSGKWACLACKGEAHNNNNKFPKTSRSWTRFVIQRTRLTFVYRWTKNGSWATTKFKISWVESWLNQQNICGTSWKGWYLTNYIQQSQPGKHRQQLYREKTILSSSKYDKVWICTYISGTLMLAYIYIYTYMYIYIYIYTFIDTQNRACMY